MNRWKSIYDGVEIPVAPIKPGGGKRLGCVGWLLPEKGQELLIRAMPLVLARHPDCSLVLAGDGPSRAGLEKSGRGSGRRGSSAVPRPRGRCRRSLSITRYFRFPLAGGAVGKFAAVGHAYGLPCVAMASGAVPEVIEHEKSGLLVDKAEPATLRHDHAPIRRPVAQLLASVRPRAARVGSVYRSPHGHRYRRAISPDQRLNCYVLSRSGLPVP